MIEEQPMGEKGKKGEEGQALREQGWKVCCSETRIRFDTDTLAMILVCPHGRQELGLPSLRAKLAALATPETSPLPLDKPSEGGI